MAATRGFETPRFICADQILVGGLRFPFANTDDTSGPPAATLDAAARAIKRETKKTSWLIATICPHDWTACKGSR